DGLLVDSGPPNLAHDVRRLVSNLAVRQCVTTHHHEDHSGNHGLLAAELRITPLAHAIGVSRLAVAEPHSQLYRRVAPCARARGAGRGTAARQARLPGRAGRADPRAARARVEPRGHRACAPGERPPVAGVDRRGLLEAKLRAGVPANRLCPLRYSRAPASPSACASASQPSSDAPAALRCPPPPNRWARPAPSTAAWRR